MSEPRTPLILIDGSSWLFRAFHALPPLSSAAGEPTGAVFGMLNMVRRLLKDYAPEHLVVVFDPPGKTFREDWYPAYKANRGETPPDLVSQFPRVTEVLKAMGLPVVSMAGVEADDVIGTLTAQARARHQAVLIVTSDKDMAQLVDEQVHLLDTMKDRRLDLAGVQEKFGVSAEQIIDYLALMGDTSDNIPGVHGVGPKTAAKWLAEFGSLDALMQRADEIKGKAGENLRAALNHLPLSRKLATIVCDLDLPFSLDELTIGPRDEAALTALSQTLGLKPERMGAAPAAAPHSASQPTEVASVAPTRAHLPTRVDCVLTGDQLETLVQALEAAPLICVDTETDALDAQQAGLVGLAFAVAPEHGWYVPLAHDYLGAPEQLPMADVIAKLKPILEDASKPKLGQHLKYDLNVLARHGITVQGVAHDTMLQSYVLDAAGHRHDMDTLAKKYLDHTTISFQDVAGKGKSQLSFNQIALAEAAPYSAEDADITLRLHQVLYPQIVAEPSLAAVYHRLEIPLVGVLAEIERVGVRVDVPLLKHISQELAQRMSVLEQRCHEAAGQPFNLGSPKQLGTILFEQLQLRVVSKTPKGEPSTAEEVLEELAAEHPLPRLILEWRSVAKLRSTYTETLPQMVNPATGRIHTSYHQAVAATGRLSSSDPNLQNIPIRSDDGRRIRQAFIAEEGQALLAIDYSQIELRLMAHFSGDDKLQAAFLAGQDIHRATAAEVFGTPLEQVTSEQRRAAKAINFGLIYGISAFGLARNLGIERSEAGAIIERFFTRYPGVKRFMDSTREQARARGYVETLRGRRLYLPSITSRNAAQRQYAERTAINAPLQGTAADLIKEAMLDVHAFLKAEAPDVRIIMQVHDELVFEGPGDHLRALAEPLALRMCRLSSLSVPLVADFGIGANWNASHTPLGSVSS